MTKDIICLHNMKILYYNNEKAIECLNPIDKTYSISFSKFDSDEKDESGKTIIKCCNERVKGLPSTYDVQQIVLNGIQEYAKTDEIKQAILNKGNKTYKGWLDSETRTSLLSTIDAKIASDINNIIIWFGESPIEMTCKEAINFIDIIELYSSDCFNVVQHKINYIKSTLDFDKIVEYNIISDYPDKPIFTIN